MADFIGAIDDPRFSQKARDAAKEVHGNHHFLPWVDDVRLSYQGDLDDVTLREKIVIVVADGAREPPDNLLTEHRGFEVAYIGRSRMGTDY